MNIYENIDLKNIAWIKIGGKCKKFIEVDNTNDLNTLVHGFHTNNEAFDVIGWSCNTLFSDMDFEKNLIKIKTKEIVIGFDRSRLPISIPKTVDARHVIFKTNKITSGFETDDIEYDEKAGDEIIVKVDAGVALSSLINTLNNEAIVGLHYFAGIPSSIGAAAINNIHGGPKNMSEYIYALEIIDLNGNIRLMTNEDMQYDYDYSILQYGGAVVTHVYFLLRIGDKERGIRASVQWAKKKSTQPKNSLGSAFHNLTRDDQQRLSLPTPGLAYLIEHVLKLSGYRVGGIMIPEQTASDQPQINKNIIVNMGDGKAEEYLAVLEKVWDQAYEQCGLKLKTEIHFKGFEKERIQKFLD